MDQKEIAMNGAGVAELGFPMWPQFDPKTKQDMADALDSGLVSYWTGKKYLGCGPSAHSYNGTSRQWNIASLDKYIAGINNHAPIYEIENLDLYTRYNDFVITTIRTSAGMSLTLLKNTFGDTLYNYCLRMARPHLNQGTLEITNNTLKLTEAGIFISDGIMSDMLWVD